jgi:hypothetical protein
MAVAIFTFAASGCESMRAGATTSRYDVATRAAASHAFAKPGAHTRVIVHIIE